MPDRLTDTVKELERLGGVQSVMRTASACLVTRQLPWSPSSRDS
jgi:hypothetical protein